MSVGWSWFWQCDVVQTWAGSQVFMYRMRRAPCAVERDQAAAVDHDVRAVVEDAGRRAHRDRDRRRAAVERDDPALGHRVDHGLPRCSCPGVPVPTTGRVGGVDEAGRGGDRRVPGRVAGCRSRRVDRRELEGSLEERGHLTSGDVALRTEPAATAARRDAGGRQPVDREPERMARRDVAEARRRSWRPGQAHARGTRPSGRG